MRLRRRLLRLGAKTGDVLGAFLSVCVAAYFLSLAVAGTWSLAVHGRGATPDPVTLVVRLASGEIRP